MDAKTTLVTHVLTVTLLTWSLLSLGQGVRQDPAIPRNEHEKAMILSSRNHSGRWVRTESEVLVFLSAKAPSKSYKPISPRLTRPTDAHRPSIGSTTNGRSLTPSSFPVQTPQAAIVSFAPLTDPGPDEPEIEYVPGQSGLYFRANNPNYGVSIYESPAASKEICTFIFDAASSVSYVPLWRLRSQRTNHPSPEQYYVCFGGEDGARWPITVREGYATYVRPPRMPALVVHWDRPCDHLICALRKDGEPKDFRAESFNSELTSTTRLSPGTYVLYVACNKAGDKSSTGHRPIQFSILPGKVTHIKPPVGHVLLPTGSYSWSDITFYDATGQRLPDSPSVSRDLEFDLAPGKYTVKLYAGSSFAREYYVTVEAGKTVRLNNVRHR